MIKNPDTFTASPPRSALVSERSGGVGSSSRGGVESRNAGRKAEALGRKVKSSVLTPIGTAGFASGPRDSFSDPRVEGFVRAISLYFGIPISELQSLWSAQREGAPAPVRGTSAAGAPPRGNGRG